MSEIIPFVFFFYFSSEFQELSCHVKRQGTPCTGFHCVTGPTHRQPFTLILAQLDSPVYLYTEGESQREPMKAKVHIERSYILAVS